MRASDADRDRATEALRRDHGAGRITDDELEERLAVVLAARTLEQIAAAFADLSPPPPPPLPPPPVLPPPPGAPPPVEIGGYGLRAFRQVHRFPTDRGTVWGEIMTHMAPAMSAYGYTVVDRHEPDYIVFEIEERSAWPWLFLGFLAVFYRGRPSRVVVAITEPTAGHAELMVSGAARRTVRKAFAGISGPRGA